MAVNKSKILESVIARSEKARVILELPAPARQNGRADIRVSGRADRANKENMTIDNVSCHSVCFVRLCGV